MEEKAAAAPMLRIPAMLMPSYNNVMATEDGKQAQKRVRVLCGVCEKIRYYSIHRGVTRIGGVIACEACRHFYQKFKRQPCILTCTEGGGCLDLNDNSRNRCRACWIGHILSRCPVPPEMYQNLISHLPQPIRERMPPEAQVAGNIPENRKGSLGLEVSRNGEWEDVTVAADFEAEPNGDSNAEASSVNEPAAQWWMQSDSQSDLNSSNQTYFNMGNMESSGGLTSLTAMQPVEGLQALMPLTPVLYPQDQQQANGFHEFVTVENIKQESEADPRDGECSEARLFQNITVKEFFPNRSSTDDKIPIFSGHYFDQSETEKDTSLDVNVKFVTQGHETFKSENGLNLQEGSEESLSLESTPQPKKKAKSPESAEEKINNIKQEPGTVPFSSFVHIKQEIEDNSQDGESLKACPTTGVTVKEEFYPNHSYTEDSIPIYSSPYFDQSQSKQQSPLGIDIKFVNEDQDLYKAQNGFNVQKDNKQLISFNNVIQPTKNAKPSKSKQDKANNKKVSEGECEKPRKKHDRFDGIPLEIVLQKFLPDHLAHNLDILIIGINPGLFAAHVGHHYAGPGNHFWKCMFLSGLIPEPFNAYDDFRMLDYGIGFTNVVARTTRSSTDLSKKEMQDGSKILKVKIQEYRPRIAVFNGKQIYEIYSGKKHFFFGKQPEKIEGTDTHIWVMPSSSARCAQLPRAVDKVPFYAALRKFLDFLLGKTQDLDEGEVVFSVKLTNVKKAPKVELEDLNEGESNSCASALADSNNISPVKGRHSPQKRKSEHTITAKKK
ncbi:uncharacterized protein [Palaemon carinicauda]|uniref:uncharacterized protein n=1 Tax=Palaemon carinicauda TaxID=392227 RepID=UPI0035B6A079